MENSFTIAFMDPEIEGGAEFFKSVQSLCFSLLSLSDKYRFLMHFYSFMLFPCWL